MRVSIIGQKFNQLTVLKLMERKTYQRSKYLCKCDCGKTTIVDGSAIKNGNTKSCGCLLKTTDKAYRYKTTHGMSRTSTYYAWQQMIQRCNNSTSQNYFRYGARGISVCIRWLKFENFLSDMGIKPEGSSLDRIDNNGNYEPSNCRWASNAQQNLNRRMFVNNYE